MAQTSKPRQCADAVLMLRPSNFGFNEATAASNVFQNLPELTHEEVHRRALVEFESLRAALEDAGIGVIVFDGTGKSPDAIFPNNWFSTHQDGTIVLYPMEGENRRLERSNDIVTWLVERYGFENVIDLTAYEAHGRFLEGTGSMVLDRVNMIAYACLSSRTDIDVLQELAGRIAYGKIVPFHASVSAGGGAGFVYPIYHTNVMMALGESTAVICAQSISNGQERGKVLSSLLGTGFDVLEITTEQLDKFAGNMLQLRTPQGNLYWVMSSQAHASLLPHQVRKLKADGSHLLHVPLETIELVGGGSARCMLAEIFSPR